MAEEIRDVLIKLGSKDQHTIKDFHPSGEEPLILLLELQRFGNDQIAPYYFPLVFQNKAEAAEIFLRLHLGLIEE